MKTLEQMVAHVKAANGFWGLDFGTLADGLEDAMKRIQALEVKKKTAA